MGSRVSINYTHLSRDVVSNILSYLPDAEYTTLCMLSKQIREGYLTEMVRRYKQLPFSCDFVYKTLEQQEQKGDKWTMLDRYRRSDDKELYKLLLDNTDPHERERYIEYGVETLEGTLQTFRYRRTRRRPILSIFGCF